MSKNGTQVSRREFGALASGLLVTTALGAAACGTTGGGSPGRSGAAGDPFRMLAEEHREVDRMLQRIVSTQDPGDRRELLSEVRLALTRHAVAEENALYPVAVEQASLRDEAPELFQEHGQIKVALCQLEQAPAEGQAFTRGVMALRQFILDHAGEEESEVFPRLRNALAPAQVQRLDQMLRRERSVVSA